MPILVFLGLNVLDLGPMYATDIRQMSDVHHCLMQEKQKRTYIGAYINGLTD